MTTLRSFLRARYLAAMFAGLALAAAFPNFGVAGLAWTMPGVILFIGAGLGGKQVFRVGYVAGLGLYLMTLYWLLLIPVELKWTWAKALGWLALSAYLALYPATWVWLCWKMFPVKWDGPFSFGKCAERYASVGWPRRLLWALSGAALWVALEMTVSRLMGGFPWILLGESQYQIVPLIQIASVTGIYGVSFLLVWFSISFMSAVVLLARRRTERSMLFAEIVVPALVVAVVFAAGYRKILEPEAKVGELTVALVQPSIPQSNIWDPKENEYRFQQLIKLSEQALTNKPDLLIWPEAAVPGMIRWDAGISNAITQLARRGKVWMIVGSDDFVPNPGAKTWKDGNYYNSSFLISPDGELAATYQKRNLVIFGEYIPFVKWLPFLKYLTPIGEDGFSAGPGQASFFMPSLKARTSVMICYEDVFPHLLRKDSWHDPDFLVNITNDGWFGEGAEQWQHAAAGVFRAVENGTQLLRCCNNGLTCWIDEKGRIRQFFKSDQHGIYGPGYMLTKVPLPDGKRLSTPYLMSGDCFGWGCVALVVVRLILVSLRKKSKSAAI